MDRRDCLAGMHQGVVADFIEAVDDEWASDRSVLERNLLGALLRSELETRLVPGLTATLALLMEAEAGVLGQDLPEWLDRVSGPLPAESAFLTEMGRRVDPAGGGLLEENSGLSAGESLAAREFRDRLWSMAPLVPRSLLGG